MEYVDVVSMVGRAYASALADSLEARDAGARDAARHTAQVLGLSGDVGDVIADACANAFRHQLHNGQAVQQMVQRPASAVL